jgi:hypothetical protein
MSLVRPLWERNAIIELIHPQYGGGTLPQNVANYFPCEDLHKDIDDDWNVLVFYAA